MKRSFVLIAAIVAVVGLGAAVAVARDTTKVRTSVSIKFARTPNPTEFGAFSGNVKAKKGCKKDRKVVLRDAHRPGGRGSDRTNDRGRYRIPMAHLRVGHFFVQAKRTIIENDGEEIVCKGARSKQVSIR